MYISSKFNKVSIELKLTLKFNWGLCNPDLTVVFIDISCQDVNIVGNNDLMFCNPTL
jgi:hypothetical protein